MTRYYVCGDGWTIREIEPSTGYLLNETIYEVGASLPCMKWNSIPQKIR